MPHRTGDNVCPAAAIGTDEMRTIRRHGQISTRNKGNTGVNEIAAAGLKFVGWTTEDHNMWFVGTDKPVPVRTRKRQHERFVSDLLTCAMGRVLDLSASGIRIAAQGRCKLKLGEIIRLTLDAPQGSLTLAARIVRIEKKGFRAHELGLEFVGMKPSTCHALKRLAEFGFVASAGIAGSTVGSYESGDMGGGPRAASPAELKSSPAKTKLDRARQILCVGSAASAEEIRAAYRKLAHRYHPDAKPGPEAERQFADIVSAYRMLRDAVEAPPTHG